MNNVENEIRQLASNTYKIKKAMLQCYVNVAFDDNTIIIHYSDIYDIPTAIDILKNEQFDLRLLNEELFSCAPNLLNDLFHFRKYDECKKILENEIDVLNEKFENEKFKNDRATILRYDNDRNNYNEHINTINVIVEANNEFRKLLFLAIPDLEIEFNRLLSDYNLQNNSNIKNIIPLPTWANKNDLETIWSELVSLNFADEKDKNNFLAAFGHGDDSLPFEKFSLGTSANNLMVFLILIIDRTSKTLPVKNRTLANDLFTIQLNITTKPNKQDIETWSDKLRTTDRLRKLTTQYEDDFEPIIE